MNWNQPYEVLREENYIIRMQVPKSYDRNGYKMVSRKRASKPWLVWLSWLGVVSQSEGCRFNSKSGCMPRFQVSSPVSWGTYERKLTNVSLSHRCFQRMRASSSWWDDFPARFGLCPDLMSLSLVLCICSWQIPMAQLLSCPSILSISLLQKSVSGYYSSPRTLFIQVNPSMVF